MSQENNWLTTETILIDRHDESTKLILNFNRKTETWIGFSNGVNPIRTHLGSAAAAQGEEVELRLNGTHWQVTSVPFV